MPRVVLADEGTVMGRENEMDADVDVVEGRQPPSQRTPLTRETIVVAAIDYIDRFGLPSLSMRRLGASLGVEAMSLYRYVPGRENLLDAVVESVVATMRDDPDVLVRPEAGWQDFLQRLAHGVRRTAIAHPKVFPLIASRPPEAPWLRPPLRSVDWVETFLDGLLVEGFSDEAAVAAYRSFSSFLLGHLLLEVSTMGADVGPLDVIDDQESANEKDLDTDSTVHRLRGPLAQDHSAAEFEEALENLLDRIAQTRSELD